ncbi:hypothetical protein TrRE_jg9501 [Triparma retinervis]|uniref:Aminotransferase class I/classII domain-containing protein n=1 Tax=Triparma retinervis TaxID=2557542 RepID=A0A9W7AGW5_9STRA|nr:hypothetical protein TrRE_jg9501 [Triparma retinervis]
MNNSIFSTFSDIPVSPHEGYGASPSKSVSFGGQSGRSSRIEESLLRSTQKRSPPKFSAQTHTFSVGGVSPSPRRSKVSGGEGGRTPPSSSNLIAAAKLIDNAQREVDLARATGREKDAEIASLSDLLNRSMLRQTSLEERLLEMNGKMLECLSMKNTSQQVASQATHDCRVAKAYSIEYMKRMEAAEREMDEERAARKLVELRLLKATKELAAERRAKMGGESDAREMVVKNEGLERYGKMLEGEKERLEGEVVRWKKGKEEAELKEAEARVKNARRMEEVNSRCIELQRELERLGKVEGGGEEEMPPCDSRGLHVAVIGGGPAGLAVGVALQKDGHEVRIFEKDSISRPGFGWLIMPNGVAALDKLGCSSLLKDCLALEKSELVDPAAESADKIRTTVTMASCYSASRQNVVSNLRAPLKEGTFAAGYDCSAALFNGQTMKVGRLEFSNGHVIKEDDYDLIVGADGVNSRLAQLCNNSMKRDNLHTRVNTIVTSMSCPQLAKKIKGVFTKTMLHSSISQRAAIGILAPTESDVLSFVQFDTQVHGACPRKIDERHAFVLKVLGLPEDRQGEDAKHIPPIVYEFFDLGGNFSHPDNCHIWRPLELPNMDHNFTLGNCCLVGDAAHPLSDFTSQGISSALEDAVLLAEKLQKFGKAEMGKALAEYAGERKRVVTRYWRAGCCILKNFCDESAHEYTRPFTRTGSVISNDGNGGLTTQTSGRGELPVTASDLRRFHAMHSSHSLKHIKVDNSDNSRCREPEATTFNNSEVNLDILKIRAFNYRWASVPEGVLPLTAASTDFPVAEPIRRAVSNYIMDGYINYTPNEGLPEFRDSYSKFCTKKLTKANRFASGLLSGKKVINACEVMPINAAAAGVYHVAQRVLSEPGDEALVMAPVDFLLAKSIQALPGRVLKRYGLSDLSEDQDGVHYTFDLNEMESLVTDRTKMISICNPHNPLGMAWSQTELAAIADFADKHDLMIFSDEVWCDIVYEPKVHIPMAAVSESAAKRTFTVTGFSKNFGLEGARVGGLIAPSTEELAKCSEASNTTAGGTSSLAQIAAVAAMEECEDWLEEWRSHVKANMAYCVQRLKAMGRLGVGKRRQVGMPEACFVIFADINDVLEKGREDAKKEALEMAAAEGMEGKLGMGLMQWLIKHHKVAIIPGLEDFFGPGSNGHIRISVSTSREILTDGMDRLENGLIDWLGHK